MYIRKKVTLPTTRFKNKPYENKEVYVTCLEALYPVYNYNKIIIINILFYLKHMNQVSYKNILRKTCWLLQLIFSYGLFLLYLFLA